MRLLLVMAILVGFATANSASAQSVRSEVTAENGVLVTLYADEFAQRYEYTAPEVSTPEGFVFVARIDRGGSKGAIRLIGNFSYNGDWRFYDTALFRGGDAAEFVSQGRDVGRCRASRYSRGCTLSERFAIDLTPAQIAQHARDGKLDIQIRAGRTAQSTLVSIPISYFEAVRQVADARP